MLLQKITSLHLNGNKVSAVIISSQLPKRVSLPQKIGGELFLYCVCWVWFFLPQENYFRFNPVLSHSSNSVGGTAAPASSAAVPGHLSVQTSAWKRAEAKTCRELCTRLHQQCHRTEMCSQT